MRTIAIVNQKGGCGKTTTAINLSAFLAHAGRKTLVVDMDPQGHATLGLLPGGVQPSRTMYDVLVHYRNGRDTRLPDITRSVQPNLDVAPADVVLSALPDALAGVPQRERILADVIAEVASDYDYAIVDCPPHVGLLTFNALYACSEAIVPVDPSFFSLHGIGKLLETIDLLTKETGHAISVRALVTLYSGRTQFGRDIVDEIHKHLEGRYFTTTIRHSAKLPEAASHGVPILSYSTRSVGFADYASLAGEVMQMETDAPLAARLRPAPPKTTPQGVVFAIEAPAAHRVQLVGDFNNWAVDEIEMQADGRVWTRVLPLTPGRYRYRYVVDGQWQHDPLNAELEPAPYGGHNSVLIVGEEPSPSPQPTT